MQIVLVNQFYPPDVAPTGVVLHDLARKLALSHQVRVVCSRRSYGGGDSYPAHELRDGVEILRLPSWGYGRKGIVPKLLGYASFYFFLALRLLFMRPKPDLILALTTPPYAGLLAKFVAGLRGCGHAHWIMDLYPDVMASHGLTDETGLFYRLLQALTRLQFRGYRLVLSLGPTMQQKVQAYLEPGRAVPLEPAVPDATLTPAFSLLPPVFPFFTRREPSQPLKPPLSTWVALWAPRGLEPWPAGQPNPMRLERGWDREKLVLLYSGNMGLGHCFREFLAAARRLGPRGPLWAFAGGGQRRPEIEAFAKANPQANIKMYPYAPAGRLAESLCAADLHLASLDPRWQGLMVPSKIQGIFQVGKPVIFVGGRENEIAEWILDSGGGWVVGPHDVAGLLQALDQALDAGQREARGKAARAYALRHFDLETNTSLIAATLEQGDARA